MNRRVYVFYIESCVSGKLNIVPIASPPAEFIAPPKHYTIKSCIFNQSVSRLKRYVIPRTVPKAIIYSYHDITSG